MNAMKLIAACEQQTWDAMGHYQAMLDHLNRQQAQLERLRERLEETPMDYQI